MERQLTTPTATLILLTMVSSTFAQQADIVNTTLGCVQGLRKTVLGKDVDVYYGIPFAKPPVGELRFKRPEPAEPWTDIKSTVTKPNACFQSIDTAFDRFPGVEMWNPNTPMSEDCLYLNVWVPRGFESQPPNATMVWIYGGGFFAGSSMLDVYDGSKLAVTQNVIVASMNYRLGPLGFLYTGTVDAPGNQGLLDQSLALKWIYDNIERFGGERNTITIFGESAGSMSVGFHLLSNLSTNHFSRAIMQSGAPNLDSLLREQSVAIGRARSLSEMFNCSRRQLSEMMQCMQQVDAGTLTDAQWYLLTSGYYFEMPLGPVVDNYFLTDYPRILLAQGAVKDTELLTGVNKDEGTYFLVYGMPNRFPLDLPSNISDAEFKEMMYVLTWNGEESLVKAITYEYVDRVVPAQRGSYWDIADDVSGDDIISCPTVDFASAFTSLGGGRDVYLYSFEHRLSNNPWPEWMGVMHGYEIEAVFGLPLDYNYTQGEEDLASRMMGYWTRFAQTGNPNDPGNVWPKLTSREAQYLKITAQGDSVGQGLRRDQCSFRSTVLPLVTDCPDD
ncbi:acetylcholinesterase-like isoform X2 [Babylonia areolata]